MTRSKFIRLSGWSLILGAVTFFLFIPGAYLENKVYDPFRHLVPLTDFGFLLSVWVTPILLGVGLLGLRIRYGNEVGGLGKNMLLLGAIAGPVINIIGPIIITSGDWSWFLPFTGNAVLLACLSIFGTSALSAKPLPRWNSLPIISGVWYPVFIILVVIFQAMGLSQSWFDDLANPAYITIPLQCALLIVLGYILQGDVREKTISVA